MTPDPVVVRKAPGRGCRKDYMPIGTVVVRADKDAGGRRRLTRYIKVNDAFPTGKRWLPYARWWWEQNKGPVPKGQLVLRKDGDTMNDDPSNLMLGTCGMKLVLAHRRDKAWSKDQHARAAAKCADKNRIRGRIFRAAKLVKNAWYPVVDCMSTILNTPFRKRRLLLGAYGLDVTCYPRNGHGKKPQSALQRMLSKTQMRPVSGDVLSAKRYQSYTIITPDTKEVRGPVGGPVSKLVAALDEMGVWKHAEKVARRDSKERK